MQQSTRLRERRESSFHSPARSWDAFLSLRVLASLLWLVSSPSVGATETPDPGRLLCSPQGLSQLIPQFKVDAYGQLIVPDPTENLQNFLGAQQGLSNLITAVLAKENSELKDLSSLANPPAALRFGNYWLAAEIGVKSSGKSITSVDRTFAYRGESFLSGLQPIEMSQGIYYAIRKDHSSTTFPALVYPFPTVNPCVNGLVLAAGDTVGSWPQPTYALGKYQTDAQGVPDPAQPLEAYLIVNICLDLGTPKRELSGSVLKPLSQIVTAMHWSCDPKSLSPGCKTSGKAHQH